jgi:hypothetical protein
MGARDPRDISTRGIDIPGEHFECVRVADNAVKALAMVFFERYRESTMQ